MLTLDSLAARGGPVPRGRPRPRRPRRGAVHLGHHRQAEGRDADPRQRPRQRRDGRRAAAARCRRPGRDDAAAVSRQRAGRHLRDPDDDRLRGRDVGALLGLARSGRRSPSSSRSRSQPSRRSSPRCCTRRARPAGRTSLRYVICGAAPLSRELLEAFESRFDIRILEGYGLTEATCISSLNPFYGPRKPGSIGLPMRGQQMKIVDAGRRPRPRTASSARSWSRART